MNTVPKGTMAGGVMSNSHASVNGVGGFWVMSLSLVVSIPFCLLDYFIILPALSLQQTVHIRLHLST